MSALTEAAKARNLKFKKDSALAEWKDETYNRVNAMMKQVKKNCSRPKPPSWTRKLGVSLPSSGAECEEEEEEEEEGEEGEEGAEAVPDADHEVTEPDGECTAADRKTNKPVVEPGTAATDRKGEHKPVTENGAQQNAATEYVHSWDQEKCLATRRPRGSRKTVPWELCVGVELPPGDPEPSDSMLARWADGTTTEIAQYTVAKFKGEQVGKKKAGGKKAAKTIYKNTFNKDLPDGSSLIVLLRDNNYRGKPKQRLCCMRDGEGQVCQLDVKHFYQEEFTDKSEEGQLYQAEEKALEWMCALAERYFKKELTREETIGIKKKFLEDLQSKGKSKGKGGSRGRGGEKDTAEDGADAVEDGAEKAEAPAPAEADAESGVSPASVAVPKAPPAALGPTAVKSGAPNSAAASRGATESAPRSAPSTPPPKRATDAQPEEMLKRQRISPPAWSDSE
jgi:hypothetical protein